MKCAARYLTQKSILQHARGLFVGAVSPVIKENKTQKKDDITVADAKNKIREYVYGSKEGRASDIELSDAARKLGLFYKKSDGEQFYRGEVVPACLEDYPQEGIFELTKYTSITTDRKIAGAFASLVHPGHLKKWIAEFGLSRDTLGENTMRIMLDVKIPNGFPLIKIPNNITPPQGMSPFREHEIVVPKGTVIELTKKPLPRIHSTSIFPYIARILPRDIESSQIPDECSASNT